MNPDADRSQDEARIADRPLYRPGQTPPPKTAPSKKKDKPSLLGKLWGASSEGSVKTAPTSGRLTPPVPQSSLPAPKSSKSKVAKGPSRLGRLWQRSRKHLLAILALLLMGTISYCVFLPDPVEEAKQELAALRDDKSMPREERREKFGKIMSSLSEKQKYDMMGKQWMERERERTRAFAKLSKQEQIAQLKKEILEDEKRRERFMAARAANGGRGGAPGGGGRTGGAPGGGAGASGRGGPGGGGPGGGGPGGGGPAAGNRGGGPGGGGPGGPGGGPGGRGGDNHGRSKNFLDMSDPETRATGSYMRGLKADLRQQMGLPAGGGWGGFGGGPRGRRP
jgi:hypothetical protein